MKPNDNVQNKIRASRKEVMERLCEVMWPGEGTSQDGVLTWQLPYRADLLRPQNPATGVKYRGGNRIRLWNAVFARGYQDARWMTYQQIQNAGYRLRDAKGQGVLLEHWRYTKMEEQRDENGNVLRDAQGEILRREVRLERPIPGYFYVFNGDLIEGLPPVKAQTQHFAQIGELLMESSECPIYERAVAEAFYNPMTDDITLPPKAYFREEAEFYAVMLHEMSHATGAPNRLHRETLERYGENRVWRAKEELRAELGSVFLRAELGIPLNEAAYRQSGAYIESWQTCLTEEPDELFRAAADAEKICDRVMERYLVMTKQLEVRQRQVNENMQRAFYPGAAIAEEPEEDFTVTEELTLTM